MSIYISKYDNAEIVINYYQKHPQEIDRLTEDNKDKLEKNITEDQRIIGSIKSNMLLIGPTGVGKTYIIKLIAKKIGVPLHLPSMFGKRMDVMVQWLSDSLK